MLLFANGLEVFVSLSFVQNWTTKRLSSLDTIVYLVVLK